jgi:F-type H+-transporting ATPase subunit epsilon
MKILVLTPAKRLVETEAQDIYFPTEEGFLHVLEGHACMNTSIGTGTVEYSRGEGGILHVSGGVAEITNTSVTLLVDAAELASEIDVERAQKALNRAESRLSHKLPGKLDIPRAEAAQQRALSRLEVALRVGKK